MCSSLSFRILNSSAGIPLPPLALFIIMLSKAFLTSQSRMSSSRWVATTAWLSRSLRHFLNSSFVYSCHLLLLSSASVRSLWFLSLLCPSLHEMFPLYLQFSWRDFWSFPFYCFPLFLCIVHLQSLSYLSLLFSGLCIQLGVSFPFSFDFWFPSFLSYL